MRVIQSLTLFEIHFVLISWKTTRVKDMSVASIGLRKMLNLCADVSLRGWAFYSKTLANLTIM